jgi:hypothetical protein
MCVLSARCLICYGVCCVLVCLVSSVGYTCIYFWGAVYCCFLCILAREQTTCATVPGPRHRSNAPRCPSVACWHPAGLSRAGHHQGPHLHVVDREGGGGGRGGREGEGREGGGGGVSCLYLSMLFLRQACAATLRAFVRSISMFLLSCVSVVAFSLSLHVPLSSRLHLLVVAFSCALVSRAFPAPAPLAAPLMYRLPYRPFSYYIRLHFSSHLLISWQAST